jgi:hypothetical protein
MQDELKDTVPVIATIFSSLAMIGALVIMFSLFFYASFMYSQWIMMFGAVRLAFHLPLVLIFTVKSQDKKKSKSVKRTCPPKGLQYYEQSDTSPPEQLVEHCEVKKDDNGTTSLQSSKFNIFSVKNQDKKSKPKSLQYYNTEIEPEPSSSGLNSGTIPNIEDTSTTVIAHCSTAQHRLLHYQLELSPSQRRTAGDGNCMFHAILDQLSYHQGLTRFASNHRDLRSRLVNELDFYIATNRFSLGELRSPRDWQEHMLQDRQYGDSTLLHLAAQVFNRPIIIVPVNPEDAHRHMAIQAS